ncbi:MULTISPECIES: DUF2309 domain-containing protein [unclassified Dietzia]|uniref:DUF2309 domain-containing protein n=1 Tax=unclassified Dietzia TaxID=2617939 RepID=UPI000D22B8BE|nr:MULTISPECIES: DUF2309 domain-containing protein [unclassified Dietzia]AVZ40801.1 DUF2309 domain-containing protein [Dietzia sp. JS16-p6b]QGW26404.1 hypothetical protein GJR88_05168 [Dietzia sp. DQ12-45-1b]
MTTPADQRAVDRTRVRAEISVAARVLTPVWPLGSFIAVNPLGGLEHRPFHEALVAAGDLYGAEGTLGESRFRAAHAAGRITSHDLLEALERQVPEAVRAAPVEIAGRVRTPAEVLTADLLHGSIPPAPTRRLLTRSERTCPHTAAAIDALTAKWCSAFLDPGQAAWSLPGREHGFYRAWADLAARDTTLPPVARRNLRELPSDPADAVTTALHLLGVGYGGERIAYLRAHLTRLPGWAGHVLWRSNSPGSGIDLVDYLALRLSYEAHLLDASRGVPDLDPAPAPRATSRSDRAHLAARALGAIGRNADEEADVARILDHMPVASRPLVWLDAYETNYRRGLLARLRDPAPSSTSDRAEAQLVLCIDPRSEGLRRHLEGLGGYRTFGFAGFFAVACRIHGLAKGDPTVSAPALVTPQIDLYEQPAPTARGEARRTLAGLNSLTATTDAVHTAKADLAAPFVLAEILGWANGPAAAAKTIAPRHVRRWRARVRARIAPVARTVIDTASSLSLDQRVQIAETALSVMGLTTDFARLVVLCGHGASTENNPYHSALTCGACGGNAGGPNARAAVDILNDRGVRDALSGRGIAIPDDTWFVAAEHDTTTDHVVVLDRHQIPESHRDDLERLVGDLAEAGERLAIERSALLPGAPVSPEPGAAARHVDARGADWAQVYPEWGLAGNAAIIIGPRAVTEGVDLRRRCFLHSYNADEDPSGSALETILTAPVVVAQWINCQYYFSTVAPRTFGAGTKTTHNVVGGIGVVTGPGGDLRTGLPWQSVAVGDHLAHEPMRLLVLVHAPHERIDAILARNPGVRDLVDNHWITLLARNDQSPRWHHRTRGGWTPYPTEIGE